jgi:glycosyltransferase involved in cell wall biosynthesis
MPVYNAERFVAQAMQSVLDQTFTDFEFIIINDGSLDRSLQFIQKHGANDGRVVIVSRPNTGIVGALNEGLSLARGEFIARMDADDVCHRQRFERQIEYMGSHPECVAVGSSVVLIDQDDQPIRDMRAETDHQTIDDLHINARAHAMWHPTVMMRRCILNAIGGYRREYETAEDIDLFLRLAEQGRLANLEQALLRYRLHAGSIGARERVRQAQAACNAAKDARIRRGLGPLPDEGWEDDVVLSNPAQHRKWAWWALDGGNVATARKHAIRAMSARPLSPESWRVLYCAMRGR